jgi:PPOX class probable F420-dependent enzyme
VKQRDRVAMTVPEIAGLLAASRKLQLATINRDGTPHLVAMYYVMLDEQIAFWTYRTSQKAVNLARDPRLSCLVETGEQYFDLRGVQVKGVARCVDDQAAVIEIGRRIAAGLGDAPAGALNDYVAHAARKRVGYLVQPERIISWDHSKLLGSPETGGQPETGGRPTP